MAKLPRARALSRWLAAIDRNGAHFLASFFKSPLGVDEHGFVPQYEMLQQWLREGHAMHGGK
jgi:hypothetical protein